jgi:hypothetical protein
LKASAESCHWGFFDAARKPVLRINSGDRVTTDTLSGAPQFIAKSGFHVPPELAEVPARAERFEGGHPHRPDRRQGCQARARARNQHPLTIYNTA